MNSVHTNCILFSNYFVHIKSPMLCERMNEELQHEAHVFNYNGTLYFMDARRDIIKQKVFSVVLHYDDNASIVNPYILKH